MFSTVEIHEHVSAAVSDRPRLLRVCRPRLVNPFDLTSASSQRDDPNSRGFPRAEKQTVARVAWLL